ncbi:phytanoyl-CoA dioxygenase family protein [Roseitalea porphyridii]|uniref:Phytanoyl-CoA dioxygenase family protein n=1 Tax=Roseitalea porphyridii TaxID=1852022 RepID=A0A4P6V0V8_9HYPH|nr:phytanoyl-CoA dioxygenase family protein [Roseitalea porphyridii]QBK30735.1 phytanoyl-CoA dioxygenase family protein [Roseitalea porphyridii]
MERSAAVLTDEQSRALTEQGFVAVSSFVSGDELDAIRTMFDRLFKEKVGQDEGRQFDLAGGKREGSLKLPQILEPSDYAPELRDLDVIARASAITQAYFDSDATPVMGEHMIFKPAHVGNVTPWHQDQAYHDPAMDERSINFWIALDDTDVENGCMQYVPGSHGNDVLPHHPIGHDPSVHGLEVDEPEALTHTTVACPLQAGGCVMHLPKTLHYAGPNRTARQRRAYILIIQAPPVKRAVPVDNYWMRRDGG